MADPEPHDLTSSDRPNRVPWPPLIYLFAIVGAAGLERVLPLPLPLTGLDWPGLALGMGGILIAVAGVVQFKAAGTVVDPTGQARVLTTGGVYQITRNPMYLGAVVAFVGFALWLRSGWLLTSVPLIALALQKLAIEREEAYLRRRFGAAYDAYCASVGRWI